MLSFFVIYVVIFVIFFIYVVMFCHFCVMCCAFLVVCTLLAIQLFNSSACLSVYQSTSLPGTILLGKCLFNVLCGRLLFTSLCVLMSLYGLRPGEFAMDGSCDKLWLDVLHFQCQCTVVVVCFSSGFCIYYKETSIKLPESLQPYSEDSEGQPHNDSFFLGMVPTEGFSSWSGLSSGAHSSIPTNLKQKETCGIWAPLCQNLHGHPLYQSEHMK